MKKVLLFTILMLLVLTKNVYADNYKIMELIPQDKTNTIRGDYFLYKDIKYKDGKITIGKIKNISDENRKITISLGLFDKDKNNIIIVNYCSQEEVLEKNSSKENYEIKINQNKFADNKNLEDVKYYAIISENKSCRMGGEKEYAGKPIKEINNLGDNSISSSVTMLINVVKVIVIFLVVLFIYKLLFTNSYENMNGDDVRAGFEQINKQKEKEREMKRKLYPEKPKEKKQVKTDKVLEQEQAEANKKNKDDSNLHNLYK